MCVCVCVCVFRVDEPQPKPTPYPKPTLHPTLYTMRKTRQGFRVRGCGQRSNEPHFTINLHLNLKLRPKPTPRQDGQRDKEPLELHPRPQGG